MWSDIGLFAASDVPLTFMMRSVPLALTGDFVAKVAITASLPARLRQHAKGNAALANAR